MKYLITIFGIFGTILLAAHPGNLRSVEPSIWELTDGTTITGYLLYVRPSEVVIQQEDEPVVPIDIRRFNTADQVHFHKKAIDIDQLQTHSLSAAPRKAPIGLSVGILLLVLFAIYHLWKQRHRSWATLSIAGGLQLAVFVWLGFVQAVQPVSTTDPLVVDAAFAPFKPNVRTSWDAQYFYVASLGIPQHQMMVGITSWQQQVLLPQKYTCWGTGINPPLEWKNPPSGTTCYTAVMHHLDKDLAEKTYMIRYNLPASTTSIRENESGNGLWGGNTQNNLLAYSPPCSQGPGKKLISLPCMHSNNTLPLPPHPKHDRSCFKPSRA